MHDYVAMVELMVYHDVKARRVVSLDAFCRNIAPLFPELSRRELQDVILQVVITYGGAACWGCDPPLPMDLERTRAARLKTSAYSSQV